MIAVGYRLLGNLGPFLGRLSEPELQLACAIAWHVPDESGELFAAVGTMAAWCGKSSRWVREYRTGLVAAGILLDIEPPRQGRVGRYRLNLVPASQPETAEPRGRTAKSGSDTSRPQREVMEKPRGPSAKLAEQPRGMTTPASRDNDASLAARPRQGIREELLEESSE